MSATTDSIALAEISQYLWGNAISYQNDLFGGSIDVESNKKLYMERKALEYGNAQSLDNLNGASSYVFSMCGAMLNYAQSVLSSGNSGGSVIPAPSSSGLVQYLLQFNVGDVNSIFTNGGTVGTINIGVGNNFIANSMLIFLDQALLPRDNNNYVSYSVNYAAGIVTITLNQAAQTGQLYLIQFDYIIV